MMKIYLKTKDERDFRELSVPEGISAEELLELRASELFGEEPAAFHAGSEAKEISEETRLRELLPYRILCVRTENRTHSLTRKLFDGAHTELLDMRDRAAELIYQNSMILLFKKAVSELMGEVSLDIPNMLNKGLFVRFARSEAVTDAEIEALNSRMRELVRQDLPITRDRRERRDYYTLDGYTDFFYSQMVPSSGYLEYFELRPYRKELLIRLPNRTHPDSIPEYRDDVKLYKALGEATIWSYLTGVSYAEDLNKKIRDGSYRELIQLSEALHEKKISEIADAIKKSKRRIILIAGPSSSGKTTFAKRLCIQLKVNGLDPLYMGTDDYFLEREQTPKDADGNYDFENLDAMDVELFGKQMNALLAGEAVDIPVFDFVSGHKSFGQRITRISENQPVVIEGIHALNEAMTPTIDRKNKFKIYISPLTQLNIDRHNRMPHTDERMLRRIVRDWQFRDRSAARTIRDWPKVRAGEDKNIFPYSNETDMFFNSVHIYEIAVLKKYAEPLLREIGRDQAEFSEAARMLRYLQFFDTIEDDSIIVNNSIIREFIGGSIFV